MVKNSFLIAIGNASQDEAGSPDLHQFDGAHLRTCDPNSNHISLELATEGFRIFIGENTHGNHSKVSPAGTNLNYCSRKKSLTITTDRLGTAIIYWKWERDLLLFSNRLENLVDSDSKEDWSSVQQYLNSGFTIKDRTFFSDIFQSEPNKTISVSAENRPTINISERPTDLTPQSNTKETLNSLISQLCSQLDALPPSVLMMSAGWDSRTLLIQGGANIAAAYTHGDLSSREITLAHRLSGQYRLDHLFTDTRSCQLNVSIIDQMLSDVGFGVFPIWFEASHIISQWKNLPMMSGVLGELLGGHYGIMSWGSRPQKLLSALSLVSSPLITESRIRSIVDQYSTPPQTHWFVSTRGQEVLDSYRTETKGRCLTAINENFAATRDWQRAIEDFNITHRGRQYILKQAQASSNSAGYMIPFANEKLVDLSRHLEFQHRVHNLANRNMLKKVRPELLDHPMAATLVAAKHPVIMQEASRLARVLLERSRPILKRESRQLGWFNYEHLYNDNSLLQIVDSLQSEIWCKDKMRSTILGHPGRSADAGSTLDMLCKIKTVDYYLGLAS